MFTEQDITKLRDVSFTLLNRRKAIEIFGEELGDHIHRKYRDTYKDDFMLLWSYLDLASRRLLLAHINGQDPGSYVRDGQYHIVTLEKSGARVRIKEDDEGVVVDVWDNGDEEVVGSTWVTWEEIIQFVEMED